MAPSPPPSVIDVLTAGAPARRVLVALAAGAASAALLALAVARWPRAAAWLRARRLAAAPAPPAAAAVSAAELAELLQRAAAEVRAGGAGAVEATLAALESGEAAREAAEPPPPPEQRAAQRAARGARMLAAARAASAQLLHDSVRRAAELRELDPLALEAAHAHHAAAGHAGVLAASRALADAHPLHAPPAQLRQLSVEMLQLEFDVHAAAKSDWLAACAHVEALRARAAAGSDASGDASGDGDGEPLSPEQEAIVRRLVLDGGPPPALESRAFAKLLRERMFAAGATVLRSAAGAAAPGAAAARADSAQVPCFTEHVLQRHGLADRARLFATMIEHSLEEERQRHPHPARREHHAHHVLVLSQHRDRMAQLGLHGVLEAGLLAHEGEVNVDA
jgi:hypothetical protein